MNQKKGIIFLLHPKDYNEISLSSISYSNQKDVFILSNKYFPNFQNISSEQILHNFSSYIKNILWSDKMKINFTFDEIMNLKKTNTDIFIVSKEYLPNNNLSININSSKIKLIEIEDRKKILIFDDDYRYIYLNVNNGQIAPSFNANNQPNYNNFQINSNNNNSDFNINQFNINELNNFTENNNNPFQVNSGINFNNLTNFEQNNVINNNINNLGQSNNTVDYNAISPNEESKLKIIQLLILLYANEREIENLLTQGYLMNLETKNLKEFSIINKNLVDKFKQIYHYEVISNILLTQNITNIKETLQNMKYYLSLEEIKSHKNMINKDITSLSQINIKLNTKSCGECDIYKFPINFSIIHKSIINLVQNLIKKHFDDSYYNLQIGISSLFLKSKYEATKIYIYKYNNNLFNIIGVIDLFNDSWNAIYNRHLSKKTFEEYLIRKKIDINKKNQKQNLFDSSNKLLGYIYLVSLSGQNGNVTQNIIDNGIINDINNLNINKNDNVKKSNFSSIYHKLIDSINNLQPNYPNINNTTIFPLNELKGINVYIIESSKLQYCMDTIKNLRKTYDDFSFCLNNNDIISVENASETTKYSFINSEVLNYFKIDNIIVLPKLFLFIFMKDYTQKNMLIYNPKQKNYLNIINYNNNSFNIKKPTKQKIPKDIKKKHALGLENIGATCYMNATLQCLCHIDSIKNYFLNDNIYNQNVITKPNSLTKYFADVLRKLWSETYETYYAPKDFKDKISIMNPLFQGIQANDSKDLVLFIFETIHNEMNNPSQNPDQINLQNIPNELVQFRQNYYSQNYSIISKIFYYEQSNIMECQNCHYKTYNFNIMNIIIFPLEKVRLYLAKRKPEGFTVVTLYDCFEQNQEKEMLEGANQIYCNQCHKNANASSFNQFYTCPEVLTVILNRGKGLEFDVNFSFPMELTIEKYVQDKSYIPNYELIGCLTHHGPSGMAGHFVAYCKSPIDNQWYFYNDAEVTPCYNAENEMNSNGIPYILFYQRRKTQYIQNAINNNINININNNDGKPKCIYFTYEGKEGYYEYTDDNKLLYDAYNEFCNKYGWDPSGKRLMLMKDNNMIDLEEYKSLAENGINNGDKICIINN